MADTVEQSRPGRLSEGFAAATPPVDGQTITTGAEGLTAGEVTIPSGGFEMPAYCAAPAAVARPPAVLVVQEIFGVHEHIRDVCRRLARLGYCAVAPELFARQGDVSTIPDFQQIISRVVARVPDSQVMADLDATVEWLAQSGAADTSRLGITGFCWGGRIVWLYAAHNPRLRAGAAWYGQLQGVKNALRPQSAIDRAPALTAPVLGLYGARDTGIPLDDVEAMRAALKAAGKAGEIVVYPSAGHAFFADYRPSYNEAAARDGWRRMTNWFQEHGVV